MIICVLLFFGLILRLINLNQSLWLDEAVQAITSRGPFFGVLPELTGDFHPPFYHFLMWGWVRIFGSSEISLRLPSVLFGVGTIYVVWLIAKNLFPNSKKFSIFNFQFSIPEIVSLFLTTAPFHIYYSQEARMYAMTAFFTSLSMYWFVRVISNRQSVIRKKPIANRWLLVVGYIISTTLLLYSDYYGFLILLAQVIIVLLTNKKKFFSFLVSWFFCLLFFLPWLPMFINQIKVGQQVMQVLPEWGRLVNVSFIKALPLTFIKFAIGRITIFDKRIYGLIVFLLLSTYGLIIAKNFFRNKKLIINNSSFIIVLWLIVPIFFSWLDSLIIPNYQPFRLLVVLPAFYLLLALGIGYLKTTMIRIIVAGLVVVVNLASLGVYYFNPYFHREDWRGAVKYVESKNGQAAAILPSATSDWPWRYYSEGKIDVIGISPRTREVVSEDFKDRKLPNRVYYIRYLVTLYDPAEQTARWLEMTGFDKIEEVSFNQIPLWVYKRGGGS
jgi:mannosyltransferase